MLRRFFGFSMVLAAIVSCSRDDTASAHPRKSASGDGDGVPPRPSVVAPMSQPYKIVPVSAGGAITGTVDFDGTPPAPQVIRPTSDASICGNTITANNVTLSGTKVVGAIVWLMDIRTGKGFPLERRFDLTNDGCVLDPFVQVISTTSTLNVSNDDRALHTNKLINVATGEIAAIAPFNDDGEVVPIDRLKEPMEVEVVCEQHPWTHAWIAVLDHPYYAQTSKTGTFTIDGIPAGKYRVRAWHPSLGFVDDSVTVNAGQQTTVAFHIRPTGPAAAPAVVAPAASSTATAASSTPTASSTADTLKK
jgi:Polysaccharide lyase family 4, domain II